MDVEVACIHALGFFIKVEGYVCMAVWSIELEVLIKVHAHCHCPYMTSFACNGTSFLGHDLLHFL